MNVVLKAFVAALLWLVNSLIKKYWHIYVTALYSLEAGSMSIFTRPLFKPTSKWLWTKQKLPGVKILVPRTSRGRPLSTSPERPLNILLHHPGDIPIRRIQDATSRGRADLKFKRCLWDVNSWRFLEVLRTSPRGPSKHSNVDAQKFLLTFLSDLIRLTKSV